jgi:hypothetical protein
LLPVADVEPMLEGIEADDGADPEAKDAGAEEAGGAG